MRRCSSWIWSGRIVAVVVMAGLFAYLASVGLDKADHLASVLSLLVAMAALVAPYLLPSSDRSRSESGSSQRVTNTVVGGNLTQVRDAGGLRMHGPVLSEPPQAAPPGAYPLQESQGGQYVNGVWVGGHLTQADGANGDITIG